MTDFAGHKNFRVFSPPLLRNYPVELIFSTFMACNTTQVDFGVSDI